MSTEPDAAGLTSGTGLEPVPEALPDREARNPALRYVLHLGLPLSVSIVVHLGLLAFLALKTFEVMTRPSVEVGEYEASLTESLADQMRDAFRWGDVATLEAPEDVAPTESFETLTDLAAIPSFDPGQLDPGGLDAGSLGAGGALGIGDGALTLLGTGGGAGEAGSGGFGSGFGTGGARIGRAGIWDLTIRANKVAYVVDFSGSIVFSVDELKRELKRSIGRLKSSQSFNVIIFYSTGAGVAERFRTESFRPQLEPALEETRREFFDWIDRRAPQGETKPLEAMQRALALRPEAVFFFSDGYFDDGVVSEITRANQRTRTRIYCLVFDETYLDDTSGLAPQPKEGALRLKRIAEANGGALKIVTGKDLVRR